MIKPTFFYKLYFKNKLLNSYIFYFSIKFFNTNLKNYPYYIIKIKKKIKKIFKCFFYLKKNKFLNIKLKKFNILKSPHVHKKAKERFILKLYKFQFKFLIKYTKIFITLSKFENYFNIIFNNIIKNFSTNIQINIKHISLYKFILKF